MSLLGPGAALRPPPPSLHSHACRRTLPWPRSWGVDGNWFLLSETPTALLAWFGRAVARTEWPFLAFYLWSVRQKAHSGAGFWRSERGGSGEQKSKSIKGSERDLCKPGKPILLLMGFLGATVQQRVSRVPFSSRDMEEVDASLSSFTFP